MRGPRKGPFGFGASGLRLHGALYCGVPFTCKEGSCVPLSAPWLRRSAWPRIRRFAQADRTAAAFWKTVQATCDATAAKPPSELGRRIAQTAIDEFTRFGGHQIDANGRLFHFGLTEAEHEEDDGGSPAGHRRPSRLVAGDEILAGAVRRRPHGQARGARLSRRLDLDAGHAGRGAAADHRRPAAAPRRGCVRSGGARNPARGGHCARPSSTPRGRRPSSAT